MLRDITLGQYYPANSILHKLDPRVKLFGTFMYILSLFFVDSIVGYLIAFIFLVMIIKISKVPVSFMMKGLKAIMVILILTAVINALFTPGQTAFTLWKLTVTKEGIKYSIRMIIRLVLLVMGSSVMTLTTTPNNLTDGLEKSLSPLNKIKVPVHEIAMMMSIALSFIPILMEELDKIMKAQMARCADFESKKLTKRVKSLIPVLVPLFVSAFRRASDLAMAMEARCFRGGEGRTKLNPLVYKKQDRIAYLIIYIYLAVIITSIIIF